jgi:nucleotide-binding universal stress UspA family protein
MEGGSHGPNAPGGGRKRRVSVLKNKTPDSRQSHHNGPTVLVGVDFSPSSRLALRKAKSWAASQEGIVLVLHVIDQGFVKKCIQQGLGNEEEVKKKLFLNAKSKLRAFLRREGMAEDGTKMVVCEGIPCIEINNKAVENDVEMIVMGSKGNSDDMKAIFFGSTAEKVLRFIKRPVLCVPPECDYKLE